MGRARLPDHRGQREHAEKAACGSGERPARRAPTGLEGFEAEEARAIAFAARSVGAKSSGGHVAPPYLWWEKSFPQAGSPERV